MAEEKKFSDFQEDYCEERQQITFKEKKICPTCIPNPNYILERNWFEMEEGWLDESECRYKIRVSRNKVQEFLISRAEGVETLTARFPTQQQIIRYGIRRLLVQYNKFEANETVCAFGGCESNFEDIQEFQESIYEYKQKLASYYETDSTLELSSAGLLGGSLLAAVGLAGGWAVFGVAALAGIITDSVLAAQMAQDRNESFSDEQLNEVGDFLKGYFGQDLAERLDKLQALYPLIHPYALEWSAEIETSHVPSHDGEYYLLSVSAEDFNLIPLASEISPNPETEVDPTNLGDVLIDAKTFIDDFNKLNFALHGFSFFYSAFQQVEKVVIYQESDPTKKLDYTYTVSLMNQFRKNLNNVLKSNGYQRLNITSDFFTTRKNVKKVKFRFSPTETDPFNISRNEDNQLEIYVLGGDCPDYVLLEQSDALDKQKYAVVYGFLSNLQQISNDLNAQETRQWLDFTLTYFFPQYTTDYGLNSGAASEQQKNALVCFLEQELGFGDGKLIDSITESVLSAFDVLQKEFSKQACRKYEKIATGTHWEKVEKESSQTWSDIKEHKKQEKKAEMIKRFSKRTYDELIDKEIQSLKNNQQWIASPQAQRGDKPSIADIEKYTDLRLSDINTQSIIEGELEYHRNATGKAGYEAAMYAPQDNRRNTADVDLGVERGYRIKNSSWFDEATNAFNETFEQDALLIQGLKETFEDFEKPTSDEVFDFVSAIGICGMSKITEKTIECLLSGISLNSALELVVNKLIESLELRYFIDLVISNFPGNLRSQVNEILAEEFGDIDLIELLTLKKEQGSFTIGDIIGADRTLINDAYKQILKGDQVISEDKQRLSFALQDRTGRAGRRWHSDIRLALPPRDPSLMDGQYVEFYDDDLDKALKKVKRILRRRLKASNARLLEASKNRYTKIKSSVQTEISNLNSSDFIITADDIQADPTIVSEKFERTTVGVKIDKLLSFMILETIDYIADELGYDEIMQALNNHPVSGFVLDTVGKLREDCPSEPLFYPPLKDFMKTFSVDLCDPTQSLVTPRFIVPSVDWRFNIKKAIYEALSEALEEVLSSLLSNLLLKTLSLLEGVLCKSLGVVGGLVADAVTGDLGENSFLKALDRSFCGGTDDQQKARELAEQLLGMGGDPSAVSPDMRFELERVLVAISATGTTEDFLDAITSDPEDQDPQFNAAVAAAVSDVSDSFAQILGDPSQVGFFFSNLGSNLSKAEKDRIKALLDAGVPNIPISDAICLSQDELDKYNNYRNKQLQNQGLSPEDARAQVALLNQQALDALNDLLDLSSSLQSPLGPGGPPIIDALDEPTDQSNLPDSSLDDGGDGSAIDNVYDDQETCDDNQTNPFNLKSDSQMSDAVDNFMDSQYETIEKLIINETSDKDGVIGQALTDTWGNNFKKHMRRTKRRFLNANYANTQEEFDAKFDNAGILLTVLKDGTNGPYAVFPNTVGIYLREQLLDPSEVNLNNEYSVYVRNNYPTVIPGVPQLNVPVEEFVLQNGNIELLYEEGVYTELNSFKFNLSTTFRGAKFTSLGYHVGIWETYQMGLGSYADPSIIFSKHYDLDFNEQEIEYLETNNIKTDLYASQFTDFREETFKRYLNTTIKHSLQADISAETYRSFYENILNKTMKGVVNNTLTDPDGDYDGHPQGFLFGYQSDTLLPEDFEYTGGDNDSATLGTYKNPRIVPLSPELYSGIGINYENPPYTIIPHRHNGWIEISKAALPGSEGCEPKTPAVLKLDDVRDRVKKLNRSLPIDPRLSKDPDCVEEIPFDTILDPSFKANLDGNVRTTIRVFATEYFLRGMGPLSNLEYNRDNYDSLLADYIISKMKDSMMEQGTRSSSRKIRVKRKNYWYAFLEQAVECYQRMIDIEGIVPPDYLMEDLEKIQDCRDFYKYPSKELRRKFFNKGDYKSFTCPGRELDVEDLKDPNFMNWAIAYRLYGENIFKSPDPVAITNKRLILLKKIRFFSKILAIRVLEEQARSILSELVQSEIRILMEKFKKRVSDKPKIFDLKKYFLGMDDIFEGSTSNIGLTDYYARKTMGTAITGDIPDVMPDDLIMTHAHSSEDLMIVVEKYLKITDRDDKTLPETFLNRDANLTGIIPLNKFQEVFNTISMSRGTTENRNLSDFFGDLQFTYRESLIDFLIRNTAQSQSSISQIELGRNPISGTILPLLERVILLNPEKETEIREGFTSFMIGTTRSGEQAENINIMITEDMLPQGIRKKEPSGVTGNLGVSYGIRICVSPKIDTPAFSDVAFVNNDASKINKAYRFQDGNLLIPLISAEVEATDVPLDFFNPVNNYDLECLIDKLTSSVEFSIMFDKIFSLKLFSSLTSLYCSHGFPYCLGQGTDERNEDADPDPENLEFDRSFMKRTKRFLRRDFQSSYLSRTLDNDSNEDDDGDRERNFRLGNPFADINLSLNFLSGLSWFQRRRLINSPYDANGEECASPVKDLF